jgi:hypothetical protein
MLARFLIATLALSTMSAYAADSVTADNSSTSTNTSFKEKYLKNFSASHSMELYGAGVESLTGNTDGKGNAYNLIHYPSIGYTFKKPGVKLSVAGQISQTFNTDRTNDMVDFLDPYVTLSKPDLYKNEAIGLSMLGYIRYYVPASKGARESYELAAKAANDQGNGKIRLLLVPEKKLFNDKLELSVANSFYYRLAKNSNEEREALTGSANRNDMFFYYNPKLAWNATDKIQPFTEYVSGLIKHNTNGVWTRGRLDPSDGEYVGLGADFNPTKAVSLTSELTFGPPTMILNKAGIYLAASIKLL